MTAALNRLSRGTDSLTVDNNRAAFLDSANKALRIIARQYQPVRRDLIELSDEKTFSTDDLERECTKITKVVVNGSEVGYEQDVNGSGEFTVETTEDECYVYYRYVPKMLSNDIDVPEIPKHMHEYIVHYVVACERCGGDPYTQGTSSVDFQIFDQFVRSIESCKLGQPSAYRLVNY